MLGIIVFTLGRQSETYIVQHIVGLSPGRAAVCTLGSNRDLPASLDARVTALGRPASRSLEIARRVVGALSHHGLRRLDAARLAVWLATNRIRVVFCEYLQVAIAVAPVCRRLGIPVVAHAHGYDVTAQPKRGDWAATYRKELPQLAEIIVVSHRMKEQLLAYGTDAERVHVVPCGTHVFDAPARIERKPGEPYKIVAVGRLVAKKGPILLLESFRLILESGVDASLSVIGDGPFREAMRQYVMATGLEKSVHLLGERNNADVRQLLHGADLFLQHSVAAEDGDEEGLPVSILEAMAEAVPVVSTRHAAIPEAVLTANRTSVEPGDCAGMATTPSDCCGMTPCGHRWRHEREMSCGKTSQ